LTFDTRMKTASVSLGDCSFTIHLSDTERESIDKISSEHAFTDLLDIMQDRRKIYFPASTYSFAIKREVEEKNVMKKVMKFQGSTSTVEMIDVKMQDTIGSSTYRSFYKHGRMELWLSPVITDADSMCHLLLILNIRNASIWNTDRNTLQENKYCIYYVVTHTLVVI
jgi:hypothetical protein